MNLLIDGLPEDVEIGGQTVKIETGFRTGILFEEMIRDVTLSDTEKIQTALGLYFPGVYFDGIEVIQEALDRLFWFYRCGEEPQEMTGSEEDAEEGGGNDNPPFSYEYVPSGLQDRPGTPFSPLVAVSSSVPGAARGHPDHEDHRLPDHEDPGQIAEGAKTTLSAHEAHIQAPSI